MTRLSDRAIEEYIPWRAVGRTPGPRGTPSSRRPARGPAADQGVRPTSPNAEDDLSRGLTCFQVAMRLGGFGELIFGIDAQFQFAFGDPAEDVSGAPRQFLRRRDVPGKARSRKNDGALRGEQLRIEGGELAAGASERDHHAARADAVESLEKRGLAHGVVHHIDTRASGEALHFGHPVLLIVEN